MSSEAMKIRRALISVADKEGLLPFARFLSDSGVQILSTGGTAKLLASNDVPVGTVEQITGFPEILGGRVKTLHPKIHGGLLARRDLPEHLEELEAHGIAPIDLVVVNLYPFRETIAKPGVTLEEAIEQIDIGGVALIRAAAKNHAGVAVVTAPNRYEVLQKEMSESAGHISAGTRRRLAVEAFQHTAEYDATIASFLEERFGQGEAAWPEVRVCHYRLGYPLRYGENPHQKAAFYRELDPGVVGLSQAKVHQGKELSFNNLYDLDAALTIVRDFAEPTACVIKHTNPCGLASAETLAEAYEKALDCDPVSAFGSIIGVNREVDLKTAEKIHATGFVEAIIAPAYAEGVLEMFASKKNRRVLELPGMMRRDGYPAMAIKPLAGGILVQEADYADWENYEPKVVSRRAPTAEEKKALRFAFKAAKHVKSNAIVLVQGTQTVGVGAGQMSRVDSSRLAIRKAGGKAKGSVLGSDAFFPFRDGVDVAAEAGITAIIQPGGSKRDEEVIQAADEHNMAMIFTGVRHFRH